jgi:guanylate kinase
VRARTCCYGPRGEEQHGREYFFTNREDFEAQIRAGEFAEWALVHGNYYGTSKRVVAESLTRGQSVLLDIDVQGTESLKKSFGDRCVTIFIAPPSIEKLEQRLRGRGTDSEESIRRRMENARGELAQSHKFDHQLVNDDFEHTYSQLHAIVLRVLKGNS